MRSLARRIHVKGRASIPAPEPHRILGDVFKGPNHFPFPVELAKGGSARPGRDQDVVVLQHHGLEQIALDGRVPNDFPRHVKLDNLVDAGRDHGSFSRCADVPYRAASLEHDLLLDGILLVNDQDLAAAREERSAIGESLDRVRPPAKSLPSVDGPARMPARSLNRSRRGPRPGRPDHRPSIALRRARPECVPLRTLPL